MVFKHKKTRSRIEQRTVRETEKVYEKRKHTYKYASILIWWWHFWTIYCTKDMSSMLRPSPHRVSPQGLSLLSVSDNDTLRNKRTQQKTQAPPPYSRSPHGACHQTNKQGKKTRHFYIILNEEPATKTKKIDATKEKNKGFQEFCMILWSVDLLPWKDVEENEKVRFLEYRTCVLFDLYNGGAVLDLSLEEWENETRNEPIIHVNLNLCVCERVSTKEKKMLLCDRRKKRPVLC